MKKRILALTLVLIMLLLAVAGCGKAGNDGVEPTPSPSATVEPTPSPEEVPAEPDAEPTAEPTAKPTVKPTAEPTAKPTEKPAAPTNTPAPTPTPTPAPTPTPTPEKNVALTDVMGAMLGAIGSDADLFGEIPADLYPDVYQIDPSNFDGVLVTGALINVRAREIVLIKAKDDAGVAAAKQALNNRLDALNITWEHYLPDQYEIVQNSIIKTNGLYCALIVSENPEAAAAAFDNILK